jgi:hypothetical protein
MDFPYFQLEEEVALVLIIDFGAAEGQPLTILENDVLAGREMITPPHEITINGRPAAGASYRNRDDALEQVVMLADEARVLAVVAVTLADGADAFAGTFEQIFQSIRWLPAAPAPTISDDTAGLLDGYRQLSLERQGVTVAYPPGWQAGENSGWITVVPNGGDLSGSKPPYVSLTLPDPMFFSNPGEQVTAEQGLLGLYNLLAMTLDGFDWSAM